MATGTLTGKTIASTYKGLLRVASGGAADNTILDADLQIIEDGDGNNSCLQLATDQVLIKDASGTDVASCFEVQDKDSTVCLSVNGTNNRVGIGTTTPDTTLEVVGSFTTGLVTIAATDAITAVEHAGRTNLLGEVGGNALVTLTLPDATGTGNVYKFIVSVVNTSSYKFVAPDADNVIHGTIMIIDADLVIPNAYTASTGTDTIILNGTTTGGGQIGDYIVLTDIAPNTWAVSGIVTCPGGSDDATMFSETVS